jgi:hypothetical protein
MRKSTGQNRYAALPNRDLQPVQTAHLRERFELAPRSLLAEEAVRRTNEALADHEARTGQERVLPGEMVIEQGGKPLAIPLLSARWSRKLAEGFPVSAARRHLEHEQLDRLRAVEPEITLDVLWRWTDQKELVVRRRGAGESVLPDQPLDAETLDVIPRRPGDVALPESVIKPVIDGLVQDYATKPGQARAMVELAAAIREWCCPKLRQLKPGQVVWLVYGTRRGRRGSPRLLVPVVLTLLTPEDLDAPLVNRGDLKALKVRQLERITAGAWRQDGVLTMLDLEWLLGVNGALLRELLGLYQEHFGVLLPTAGTVLDMGRTLTHKTIVVEMALQGLSTQQIARRIYHTPEAVDQYLRAFDRVLMLRYYRVPKNAMCRITGHSLQLVEEHLALADKHFPTEEALAGYLANRGVELEVVG